MKKLSLIKKLLFVFSLLIILTTTMNGFVSQTKPNNHLVTTNNLKEEQIELRDEALDLRVICKKMEENPYWLEIVDLRRISGRRNKFDVIDFRNIKFYNVENSSLYEIKSFNVSQQRCYQILASNAMTKVDLGDWWWIRINQYLLRFVEIPDQNLSINVGKEVFDENFVKQELGRHISFDSCIFNEITINIEPHPTKKNLLGIYFSSSESKKIIFKGASLKIDRRYDYQSSGFNYVNVDEMIFENEVLGLNLHTFNGIKNKVEDQRSKIIFKNTGKEFDLWSANYQSKTDQYFYCMYSPVDIEIHNINTKINLLKYQFENEPDVYSEWYWALNDSEGLNNTTISISPNAYDLIQADPIQKQRWDAANLAAQKRIDKNNLIPWFKINERPEPNSISSSLVNSSTNKVIINQAVDFKINFNGPSDFYALNEQIVFMQIPEGQDHAHAILVAKEEYQMQIDNNQDNLKEKIILIKFLKPKTYHRLVFYYTLKDHNQLIDASEGINIIVELPLELELSSSYDFNQELTYNSSITFNLIANKLVDWKNQSTGIKLILKDLDDHELLFNDYFNLVWIDEETNEMQAQFKIISKTEQYLQKVIVLKVIKADDASIQTASFKITLKDYKPSFVWDDTKTIITSSIISSVLLLIISGIIIYSKHLRKNKTNK